MRLLVRCATVALTLAAAGACASSASTSQAGSAVTRGSSTRLVQDDLASTGSTNLYDAIQRLRPQWLTTSRRGGSADPMHVYLDNNRYGTIESLRNLTLAGVQEVLFVSASEATNRWGSGNTGGAIHVIMAR